MNRIAGIALLATVPAACPMTTSAMMTATPSHAPATAAAAAILAPAGKLRAAINFGNSIPALKDSATSELRGVAVELARKMGVPIELVL